jgi:hypothetical protein
MKSYEGTGSLNKRDLSLDFKITQGTDHIYDRISKKDIAGLRRVQPHADAWILRAILDGVGHRGLMMWKPGSLRVGGAERPTFGELGQCDWLQRMLKSHTPFLYGRTSHPTKVKKSIPTRSPDGVNKSTKR